MYAIVLIARLALAAVFVASGATKLADRSGTRQAIEDFGVPSTLARPAGILLPAGELCAGLALLTVTMAWYGAVAALALIGVFIVGITLNLARGRRPACHCFGAVHSEPIGWSTLARNAVLAGVAALVVWEAPVNPGPSAIGWLGQLTL